MIGRRSRFLQKKNFNLPTRMLGGHVAIPGLEREGSSTGLAWFGLVGGQSIPAVYHGDMNTPRTFPAALRLWLACLLVGWAALSGVAQARPLEKVTLQLKWQHQFQFAGYYAAQELGYYREAGLEVDIREASPGSDPVRKVVHGEAQYGVGNSSLLLNRHRGDPVVVLAVIFQHSPQVFLSRQTREISSIHDLSGKRVMVEPMSDELLAYLKQEGVKPESLTQLDHSFDPLDLLAGRVDAISAYITDEPFFLERARFPFLIFTPRSVGIDFYGDNLFTTEAELRQHPERVAAFREASLKGWQYAMRHPEEIAELILKRHGERHGRDYLLYEARQMVPLIQPELVELGYMNPGRWRHIADVYATLEMLPEDFSLKGFLYGPDLEPRLHPNVLLGLVLLGALAAIFLGVALQIARLNRRLRKAMADMVAVQARLRESETRLQQQAIRDGLTGLFNRRYLDETLELEIAQARRQGHPLSVVMLDLDHFKQVNDTYGHPAGDEVLKALGAMLREDSREGDILCRYGGEEFCLVFPNMPLAAAVTRADLWRQKFAAQTIRFGDFSMQVTFSAGVASYPEHGVHRDELIERADAALYRAKHQGRNRVEAATPGVA